MSQEGSPGYHFFSHLPQYWRRSVSGGQSEVSFPSHLAWYCREIVSGDALNALPAAVFVGERVRRSVRGIIFPAIHGRLSRPFEADSPAPPSCPLLPAKKIPPGRICPSGPGFLCRPAYCTRDNAAGKSPAVLIRRKNMKKKCRKIWRFGKKQYLCNPVRKEGHLRCPGARGNEAGESLRMESEVH